MQSSARLHAVYSYSPTERDDGCRREGDGQRHGREHRLRPRAGRRRSRRCAHEPPHHGPGHPRRDRLDGAGGRALGPARPQRGGQDQHAADRRRHHVSHHRHGRRPRSPARPGRRTGAAGPHRPCLHLPARPGGADGAHHRPHRAQRNGPAAVEGVRRRSPRTRPRVARGTPDQGARRPPVRRLLGRPARPCPHRPSPHGGPGPAAARRAVQRARPALARGPHRHHAPSGRLPAGVGDGDRHPPSGGAVPGDHPRPAPAGGARARAGSRPGRPYTHL